MRGKRFGLFVCLTACPPTNAPVGETDDPGSDTAGAGSSLSGSSTSGPSTEPTTAGPTTAEPTTASDDSANNPGLCGEGLCGQFWARWDACDLEGTVDGCPCFPETGEKCLAAWAELITCFEQTTCAEILADTTGPCWVAYQRAYEQCIFGEDGCEVFVQGGGPDDGTCVFGEDCIDQPMKRLECDAETCVCTISERVVGTCPADGVCDDFDAQSAEKIAACCGT